MKKKIASYLFFLVLAAVLLYFSFRGIKWSDFREGLKTANYIWIAISMLFGVFAFWIRGMRWRLIIRGGGYQVRRGAAFDAVNIAYLTNFALPRAGEIARCGVLAKTSRVPFDALLGTVVLERAFDMLCLLIITAAVIGLQWEVFGTFMEQQLWLPFMEALNGKTFYLTLILIAVAAIILIAIVYRKHFQKFFVFKKMYDLAVGVLHGLKSGFRMQQKIPFFGYTLVLWFSYWAMCQCTILAFPAVAQLNALDALFLMVVGSLGWVVPVQGGIGAYHFIVSLALTSVYGISQTQSLVFATISHESQAITMILFGLYSLIHIGLSSKQKTNKQQS